MLVVEHIDLFALPPDEAVAVLYHLLVRNIADPKEHRKVIGELEMPRDGEEPEDGVWSEDAMGAGFETLIGSKLPGVSTADVQPDPSPDDDPAPVT